MHEIILDVISSWDLYVISQHCKARDFLNLNSIPESGSENEDDWEEMAEEEQGSSIICLFCEECFRNAENVWIHCVSTHGVDVLKIMRMHSKSDQMCKDL